VELMDLGDRLKSLREEKKLTRGALAGKLNVSYSAVSKYETNVRFPDKGTLIQLADFFDVSVDYLLCRSDIRETAEKILNSSGERFLVSASHDMYKADEDLSPEAMEELKKFKEFVQHKYKKK
jgi:transcriptional regulator with XRE-family HTH domain